MTTWNMFSDEVREERRLVRAYGIDVINNRIRTSSYKRQALRELSLRLELEAKAEEQQDIENDLVDRLELLEHQLDCLQREPKKEPK